MRLDAVDTIQRILKVLTERKVSHTVYALTGVLVALLGAVSSILSLTTSITATGPRETTPMVVNADVVVVETTRVCEPMGPGARMMCEERSVSKTLREPFVRILITYPTEVLEQDAAEMRFVLEKVTDKPTTQTPPPDRVEIQVVSQSLAFAPKTVELMLGTETPRLTTFEAPKADQVQRKLVLVQARLKSPMGVAGLAALEPPFFDVGNLSVLVHPRQILLGLTESSLKGVQMLLSALGIPAILLFVLTFFANRYDKKNPPPQPPEKPKIVLPGDEDSRITRRSSGRR